MLGSRATAGTVYDVLQALRAGASDPLRPIVLEDFNIAMVVIDHDDDGLATQVGEGIFGFVNIQEASNSFLVIDPLPTPINIQQANNAPGPSGTQFGGASGNNELNGVFAAVIVGFGLDPVGQQGGVFPNPTPAAIMGPMPAATVIPTLSSGGGAVTWGMISQGPAGTIVELWEDATIDYPVIPPVPTAQTLYDTTVGAAGGGLDDSTHIASIGFSGPVGVPVIGGEWYTNVDIDADGIANEFRMSLNLLTPSGGIDHFIHSIGGNVGVGNNDFGTQLWGEATGLVANPSPGFAAGGDGNFSIMVPVPAAIWPGMILMGAVGLFRRRRA